MSLWILGVNLWIWRVDLLICGFVEFICEVNLWICELVEFICGLRFCKVGIFCKNEEKICGE